MVGVVSSSILLACLALMVCYSFTSSFRMVTMTMLRHSSTGGGVSRVHPASGSAGSFFVTWHSHSVGLVTELSLLHHGLLLLMQFVINVTILVFGLQCRQTGMLFLVT